jgi:hypothetical protein
MCKGYVYLYFLFGSYKIFLGKVVFIFLEIIACVIGKIKIPHVFLDCVCLFIDLCEYAHMYIYTNIHTHTTLTIVSHKEICLKRLFK